MRRLTVFLTVIAAASSSNAQVQDQNSPLSVTGQKWERIRIAGEKIDSGSVPPVRSVISENKNRQRSAREVQPKGSFDPNEVTIDGRSAALERSIQDARATKIAEHDGFRYAANVRNNSDRKIDVIFWEYRFREFANPGNLARRQFVCSVKLKPGNDVELFALSSLGPSEVISAESLANGSQRLFDEKVIVNRIEFADGEILQRRDWKMAEIKSNLDKATSTAWGREICRPL